MSNEEHLLMIKNSLDSIDDFLENNDDGSKILGDKVDEIINNLSYLDCIAIIGIFIARKPVDEPFEISLNTDNVNIFIYKVNKQLLKVRFAELLKSTTIH